MQQNDAAPLSASIQREFFLTRNILLSHYNTSNSLFTSMPLYIKAFSGV